MVDKWYSKKNSRYTYIHTYMHAYIHAIESSIDMYNNDVGKESAQNS
jgi:hypothetical protein